MKIKTVIIRLIQLISIVLIFLFVFWMENHTVNLSIIHYKMMHPHEIDLYDDIFYHTWPMFITISIYLNIIGINLTRWFYKSLNNGKIRWGGKSGND